MGITAYLSRMSTACHTDISILDSAWEKTGRRPEPTRKCDGSAWSAWLPLGTAAAVVVGPDAGRK